MIIADKSYEVSDPSIDSQIVALHDSGADIFFSWAAPKGSAQAIRKVGEFELEAEVLSWPTPQRRWLRCSSRPAFNMPRTSFRRPT